MAVGRGAHLRLAQSVSPPARAIWQADVQEAFRLLGCALICWRSLSKTWRTAWADASRWRSPNRRLPEVIGGHAAVRGAFGARPWESVYYGVFVGNPVNAGTGHLTAGDVVRSGRLLGLGEVPSLVGRGGAGEGVTLLCARRVV